MEASCYSPSVPSALPPYDPQSADSVFYPGYQPHGGYPNGRGAEVFGGTDWSNGGPTQCTGPKDMEGNAFYGSGSRLLNCQFDSQYLVSLTLNIESFDSQYEVNLTLNIESIWLSASSQLDSQYRVSLTLNIESIWLKCSLITWNPGSIFIPPVNQLFRSKWLNFFFQCTNSSSRPLVVERW